MKTYPIYKGSTIFEKIAPEVANVAYNYMEMKPEEFTQKDIDVVTQRICEERFEDALDFWVALSDVEHMSDDEDWSDVNGCIETMIEKHLKNNFSTEAEFRLQYNKGQRFILKKDVRVNKELFKKGALVEIHSIVENSIFPYNILFVERAVIHTAFSEDFFEENCEFEQK